MLTLAEFIKQRKERWERLEQLLTSLERNSITPAELLELESLLRKATADLALAEARYPNSPQLHMLRRLLIRARALVHPKHDGTAARLKAFLTTVLSESFTGNRLLVWLAIALMTIGWLFGFTLAIVRPELIGTLFGKGIEQQLAQGYVWTEGAQFQSPLLLYVQILGNNVAVAMRGFALGVFFGLGAVLILLFNGFYLGAAFGATVLHGVGFTLLEFVWTHGWLELFAVAIAAASGMRIGLAMLVPGRLSRKDALAAAGKSALPLLGYSIVLLAVAAVAESFISPRYDLPFEIKFVLGPLLLAAALLYPYTVQNHKRSEHTRYVES